jgi:hypothetical protein
VHFHPIDVLHSVELTVQQLLLVVCVLELPEDGHIDEIELLLDVEVALLVVLCRRQALLDMPPEPLEVHVEIPLQWRQVLMHYALYHPSLELVELLICVRLTQALHVTGGSVDLVECIG